MLPMLTGMRFTPAGPGKERQNGRIKLVILIACHHVPRSRYIHMARVRYELCELCYSLLTHHSAFCAAHHKRRYIDLLGGLLHSLSQGIHVIGRSSVGVNRRIPMPVVTTVVTLSQILEQTVRA